MYVKNLPKRYPVIPIELIIFILKNRVTIDAHKQNKKISKQMQSLHRYYKE